MATPENSPIKKRYEQARKRREQWDQLLDEAYKYGLPQHESPRLSKMPNEEKRGERRGGKVYDNTASVSLDERAALDVGAMFPIATRWLLTDPELENEQFAEFADKAFETCQRAFDDSNFSTEIYPAVRDARVSTGGLALNKGSAEKPFMFEAIPVKQIVPEESSDGLVRTSWRTLTVTIRQLADKWPEVKLPDDLQAKLQNEPESEIPLIEGDIYDESTAITEYHLWRGDNWQELTKRSDRVGRNIIFRSDRVPGETMGRGVVIAALPDIRTADKVVELVLKNASIAVTGIWQADDDGVLNPATIKLVPGTIIPKAVGSNGLTPLDAPGQFDVSQLVLQDLRERITRTIKGPDLPPADAGVRTAFEIGERRADQDAVEWPRLDRLEDELFIPTVRRAIWVLTDPEFAGSDYYIEPIGVGEADEAGNKTDLTTARLNTVDMLMRALETPSDRLKKETDARTSYGAIAAAVQLFGPEIVAQKLKPMDFLDDFLRNGGVKAEHLTSKDEDKRTEAQNRQAAQQEQQVQDIAVGAETAERVGQAAKTLNEATETQGNA